MAKVLISFLGKGPLADSDGKVEGKREYKKAKYKLENKEYETPFVSAAIVQHLSIDKKIIIGTSKSMWEEYYRYFHEKEADFSDELYLELAEFTDKANHETSNFPFIERLEKIFHNSSILILKYGLDEAELEYNLIQILKIDDLINPNDELYIDVTHGFRTFPLFAQQIVLYLKQVSRKNIIIKKFYYGMLDVKNELGYTPIVDMSIIHKMNDWILGTSEFINKSDGTKMVELLKTSDSDLSKLIDNFTKALNINYSHEIKKQYERILKYDFGKLNPIERLLAEKGFEEFKRHFDTKRKHSLFQLELANWYFKKRLYGVAYLTLTEAVITYVAEIIDPKNPLNKEVRDEAKKIIPYKYKDLAKLYNPINQIRKNVAHMLDKRQDTYLNDLANLEKRIKQAYELMK